MTDKPKLHIPCEACGGKGYHDLNYQKGAPCPNCTRGFVPVDAVDVWVIEANHGSKLAVFHKPGLRSSTPASLVLHEESKHD